MFPAIGVAVLEGKPGTPVAGCKDQYFLCKHHKDQIDTEGWANVRIVGWESFPEIATLSSKGHF